MATISNVSDLERANHRACICEYAKEIKAFVLKLMQLWWSGVIFNKYMTAEQRETITGAYVISVQCTISRYLYVFYII
jgi:hypothetical protein